MHLPNTNAAYSRLNERFATAYKLSAAQAVLFWDSQTNMPAGGAWGRGEQVAAIEGVVSDLLSAPDASDLLASAGEAAEALDATERANLAEMDRLTRHQIAVPKTLSMEKARLCQALQADWRAAKAENDFSRFGPGFERMMPLHREIAALKAEALGLSPYDALMDEMDPGLTTALVDPVFEDLETSLPSLLAEVVERQRSWAPPAAFTGDFSTERQKQLSYELLEAVGHTRQHSRIDAAPHPFALAGSPGDVRITTRFDADNIRFAVLATLHEAGHALYEANLPRERAFSPVGSARGATAHESQSLMMEMQAGRSREFLSWLAPRLEAAFGGDPASWTPHNVWKTYRRVGEGTIRVEADEISYPLHVILRYRIERALLSGDLPVRDLPGAWNEASRDLFGHAPKSDAQGCLQDIHWSMGMFGYFPNYALGATFAAQLFERAVADDPAVKAGLAQGDFGAYREWVKPRIHQRASETSFSSQR